MTDVQGFAATGFEKVADAFERNFTEHGALTFNVGQRISAATHAS